MTTAYDKAFTRGFSGCEMRENMTAPKKYQEDTEKGFIAGQNQRI